jgi:hypothetical protein
LIDSIGLPEFESPAEHCGAFYILSLPDLLYTLCTVFPQRVIAYGLGGTSRTGYAAGCQVDDLRRR